MFCYQCQETAKNEGCGIRGVCGKTEETANLQDLLIYVLKGIAIYAEKAKEKGSLDSRCGRFTVEALFATITNVNFDSDRIIELIREAFKLRNELKEKYGADMPDNLHDSAVWFSDDVNEFKKKAAEVGILAIENIDVRSLQMLLIYGIKGIAAYAEHAAVLGFEDEKIYDFIREALISTTKDLSVDEMVALVMRAGECAVGDMALLD
jgi:hydroxylamine reductase